MILIECVFTGIACTPVHLGDITGRQDKDERAVLCASCAGIAHGLLQLFALCTQFLLSRLDTFLQFANLSLQAVHLRFELAYVVEARVHLHVEKAEALLPRAHLLLCLIQIGFGLVERLLQFRLLRFQCLHFLAVLGIRRHGTEQDEP